MGGLAEFERKLIRQRCEEGIQRAKAKGKQFGRPRVLDIGQRRRIAERYAAGETMAALADDYGCGEVHVVIVVLAIHTERRWSRALKCFEVTDFVPAKRFSVR